MHADQSPRQARFGAPREEAWPAAFGLTTTLVWIYLELLRVPTIFNSDN